MENIIHQILSMAITLGVLVAFHEFGHFWVARRCGVKVLEFSIGFGPSLYSRIDRHGTKFTVAALPLGGFVKMLDEGDCQVSEAEKPFAFTHKSVAQRMAIVSAGPMANFILAVFVYWLIFLGGTTGLKPEIFSVMPGSIAEQAGLSIASTITAIDGDPVVSTQDVMMGLLNRIGETGVIDIETDAGHHRLAIQKWLSSEQGSPDLLGSLGFGFYRPKIEPVISEILPDSAAFKAGLQSGDRLLLMDGIVIDRWGDWSKYVRTRAGQFIALHYERDEITRLTRIRPKSIILDDGLTIGRVGIAVVVPRPPEALIVHKEYGVLSAIPASIKRTWKSVMFSLMSIKKLILGQLSYKQLSGPISIAKVASESVQSGIYSYLSLLALLSVSLGVINLLPIPVLDGGHLLFYAIEGIKGSPVPDKIQQLALHAGLAVVVSIMMLAVMNDIGRL